MIEVVEPKFLQRKTKHLSLKLEISTNKRSNLHANRPKNLYFTMQSLQSHKNHPQKDNLSSFYPDQKRQKVETVRLDQIRLRVIGLPSWLVVGGIELQARCENSSHERDRTRKIKTTRIYIGSRAYREVGRERRRGGDWGLWW